jgi:hypothetical protein
MRSFLFVIAALMLGLFTTSVGAQTLCQGAKPSPELPLRVDMNDKQPTDQHSQTAFDCFAWESFTAVNWPVGATRGQADPAKPFGTAGSTVWQSYKAPDEVFLPNGATPCPACGANPTAACLKQCFEAPGPAGRNGTPGILEATSKHTLSANLQAAPNAWLTDQNGTLTRFEIRFNQANFDAIVSHQWYDAAVQKRATGPFLFPFANGKPEGGPGAIEIKASWRVLTEKDDASRYFTMAATILDQKVDPKTGRPSPTGQYLTCKTEPVCLRQVGLVGLHIARKVQPFWQWIWATFEHVDNAPAWGKPPAGKYSYFNPDCRTGTACTANLDPVANHLPMTTPNQLVRDLPARDPLVTTPPDFDATKLYLRPDVNDYWVKQMAGTPWANYRLVATQWPDAANLASTDPNEPFTGMSFFPKTDNPFPTVLANTTMESYIQSTDPARSPQKVDQASSCIACHKAGTGRNGSPADFSFLLFHAGSSQKAATP